ncbi:polysaccharide export outer membrane protein [Wenyingzhuangia heitensis]|uniref:Polysaccharide export outer membrane protein n=1 Tax=Wenyingzhuangia heitensis TaxID=1487859 RepID=A0ABX0U652_9FLAO|nr:polysaccharide biosynthesis/export family protein [Wenyingzhuangia heitensis]NIJ44324.1 polysaccharide export outer membrane protein [Wenyingzhuangia heitensis]
MKKIKKLGVSILMLLIVSCASRRDVIYLQDLKEGNNQDTEVFKNSFSAPKFKTDDRLTINVSSINPEAARPFNLSVASFNTGGVQATSQQQQQSYLVDQKGDINFPQLGKINVLGQTRISLEVFLEKKIKPFLPDVKVNVQLVNFRVSILGEVKTPGEYIINRDKISILQVIALAGDLTIHGKRDDIKLIREEQGGIKHYNIDLRSKDVINSPAYFLQQNDIVYISPNKPQVNASASSPTASYIISATGLLITIISLLTR